MEEARGAVRALRDGLPRLSVPVATEARIQLAAIETAMRGARPDRSRVARYLGRFAQLMAAAGSPPGALAGPLPGALAGPLPGPPPGALAGPLPGALAGPLQVLADWLGPLGEPLLAVLG